MHILLKAPLHRRRRCTCGVDKRGVDEPGVARAAARCTSGSSVAQSALQERMWTWLDESRRHSLCASGWRCPVHYT